MLAKFLLEPKMSEMSGFDGNCEFSGFGVVLGDVNV